MQKTIVCIGTGPSLTDQQISTAREKGFTLFGCNNVFQRVPDLELLYGCNAAWWDTYWKELKKHAAEKWTTNQQAARRYQINWIGERMGQGLCEEPNVIHHGHGSGYSLVSMAHKKGATRILLLGYDLKYPSGYNAAAHDPGGARHYFGEYPKHLQHWPSVNVKDGIHFELVELYRSIHEQGLIEIINCSPGSALDSVIPSMDICNA